jgi:putative salt-induced outer membrane protein
MRSLLLTFVVLLVAAGARAQTPQPEASLEATLRGLEEAVARGIHAKDRTALDALLADDFVLRGSPDVPRAAWIDNAIALCWGERSDIADFTVRRLAEAVATVSFVSTFHQDPFTCEPAVIRSVITGIWVRKAGLWRLSVRHAGPAGTGDAVTQQFRREAPPPPAIEGKAELSFVSTGGNTDAQTLGTAGDVSWRAGAWKTEARAVFVRAETDDRETARALLAELRESRAISTRLDVFGRGGYQRDVYAGIDARVTLDAGLGWLAVDRAPHVLRLDGGLGYLSENRLAGDDLRSAIAQAVAKYKWALSRTTELTHDAAFLLPFEDRDAWRYANTLAVSAGLSRLFSLKLSHTLAYLHEPVPGFRKTDTILSAALVAKFAR